MTSFDNRRLIVLPDADAVAKAAAERLIARIAANSGRSAICLTGGSSPKRLYALLGTDPVRSQVPWQRVHWFISDERFVAPDHPLNNMAMARSIFLDRCAPAGNVHPIPTDTDDLETAARRYEQELKAFYGEDALDPARPLFDVALMGLGPDGHTASLFPGYPAVEENERWVTGVPEANVEPFVPRVTLSLPALNSCREMLFEVTDSGKRAILARVLEGDNLPAARAHATDETVWLVEKAAVPESFNES
jgi:6-phosphogluconolactonase